MCVREGEILCMFIYAYVFVYLRVCLYAQESSRQMQYCRGVYNIAIANTYGDVSYETLIDTSNYTRIYTNSCRSIVININLCGQVSTLSTG